MVVSDMTVDLVDHVCVGVSCKRGNDMRVNTSEELPGDEAVAKVILPESLSNLLFEPLESTPDSIGSPRVSTPVSEEWTVGVLLDPTLYDLDASLCGNVDSPWFASFGFIGRYDATLLVELDVASLEKLEFLWSAA